MRAFRARGFDVRGARNAAEAQLSAERDSPELAVVDLRMPDASGLDVVLTLRAVDPSTKVVVLTGYGSIATALEAVRRGACHYLTKPVDVDDLLAAFSRDGADVAVDLASEPPTLARVEWEHINRVLMESDGNVSKAARVLGLHRRSLQRKLNKHPVKR
ncbi:MAG: response regulator [Myxococcales bacterium]|nr:response regulator [Myxococcales bacterium]